MDGQGWIDGQICNKASIWTCYYRISGGSICLFSVNSSKFSVFENFHNKILNKSSLVSLLLQNWCIVPFTFPLVLTVPAGTETALWCELPIWCDLRDSRRPLLSIGPVPSRRHNWMFVLWIYSFESRGSLGHQKSSIKMAREIIQAWEELPVK